MERKLVIGLIALSALLVSAAVIFSFTRHNRAFNKNGMQPKLVIYTYSSFKDALGPGPEIIKKFQATCFCEIEVIDAGSGRVLLEKLALSEGRQVDLVIGLDQLNLKEALRRIKWRKLPQPEAAWDERIKPALYSNFLPYDWAPLTFIYREGELSSSMQLKTLIGSLPKNSLALQDPALSSPGLQFVYWIYSLEPGQAFAEFFRNLKPKIHSVSVKWADSYSVFQSGHARGVFTYLTSLVYHWTEENDRRYKAMEFVEGHPQQIEYMGIPSTCLSCGIAEEFMAFMLKPENQKIIMQKNYMLPVITGVVEGTAFAHLPTLKLLDTKKMDDFSDQQSELLKLWEQTIK